MRDRSGQIALRTSLIYAAVASLWILVSDRLLVALVSEPKTLARIALYKGWMFVLVTASCLYVVLRGFLRRQNREAVARQEAEAALAEEAMRRRMLIDQSSDGIAIIDANGKISEANRGFAAMLGYSAEELQSLHIWDWDVQHTREEILVCLQNPTTHSGRLETRHRRKDGSVFDVEVTCNLAVCGGQRLLFCIHRDITERKQHEAQLRKLLRAVEQSPASIVITDAAGKIEYVNPKFTALTGFSSEEVSGRNARILKSGESPPEQYADLWKTISQGREWRGTFHNRKKNGELFWEFASISPIVNETGELISYLAVKEDITERKRFEEERRALELQLRQSQKMDAIGQLAGGVAHDFNNILGATLMQLGLLHQKSNLDDETREGLAEMVAQTNRAVSLTRQLLLFSRRSVMTIEVVDVNETVENLLKMLRRLIGEHIKLEWRGKSTLPRVMADAGMLDQVVMNLVVNARDAMPNGGQIVLSTDTVTFDTRQVHLHPNAKAGRFVCLSVGDTGCGMSDEVLKRIFEPFFTTKPAGKGTGLGLATAYGIVSQHQGWISVESEHGKGSVFRVFIPANHVQTNNELNSSTFTTTAGGGETILLVEDDLSLRRPVSQLLRRLGYTVIEAATGPEAIARWQDCHSRVDLLFTDMVMPDGMTGLQLSQRLRSEKPGLNVIIASGYSADLVHQGAPIDDGVRYMQKPWTSSELAQTIRNCLEKAPARR
jgi:two-component system, cell cycle sensor histidine kinase and response regulator CckA